MEFHILGPLEVVADGRTTSIASPRQRALLALLILHANEALPADRIVEELWGDAAPASGTKSVAFHVGRLRDALAPSRHQDGGACALVTVPTGYRLDTDPGSIDAARAERLGREGRALLAGDPAAARERLTAALELWRGEALRDVGDAPFVGPEMRRLEELRLRLREDRIEADLALGRHEELVGELEQLVAAEPLRERLRGQLMLALYRSGRQAEALRTCQDARRVLAEELGIEPSPELAQLERAILRQEASILLGAAGRPSRDPYKGLRPFDEADAPDFFGREALVARLVARLQEVARDDRLLVVVGPSGCGKSSVVRAGLLPAIRRGELSGSGRWRIATMLPGSRPFEELAVALATIGPTPVDPGALRQPGGLADAIGPLVREDGGRIVLVIDQLEELFWRVRDEQTRADFVTVLAGGLRDANGRFLVVATLRADALDTALSTPGLAEAVRMGTELVGRLTADELARAITRPAAAVGIELEAGLEQRIIADVVDRPGTLPLLQYTLATLAEHGDGRRMTGASYDAIGGVSGAIAQRAEEVYSGLGPNGQATARQVFLRLVVPGDGHAPSTRRVGRRELRSVVADHLGLEATLDAFGRARLLAFDRDPLSERPTVELAHEALIVRWPRLARWIDEARDDLWMRRRLGDAAGEWAGAGRDPGYLLTDSRLELVRDWADRTGLQLSGLERAFLEASTRDAQGRAEVERARVEHERRLERQSTNRLRALAGLLAAVAILAASFAGFAVYQGALSDEQRAIAVSRELAAAAIGTLETDRDLGLLLAIEAAEATTSRGFVTEEAMSVLHLAVQEARLAYPSTTAPSGLTGGPDGPVGIRLVPLRQLIDLAIGGAPRPLTSAECRTYLHRADCPAQASTGGPDPGLRLLAGGAMVPVERVAAGSLAGTRVVLASDAPVDLAISLGDLTDRSGIVVDLVPLDEAGLATSSRVDLVVTARSGRILEAARDRAVIDLSTMLGAALDDATGLRSIGRWEIDLDRRDEVTVPGVYGVPLLASVGDLIWYPRDAFIAAGYEVPRTWESLEALTARMIADGRAPWCLGLDDDGVGGSSGADWVEELLLVDAGPATYLAWSQGRLSFEVDDVVAALRRFGSLALTPGSVLGGPRSALRTPDTVAGLALFADPPRCWLHLASSSARTSWPEVAPSGLAAFPVPPVDRHLVDVARGRVFGVALLRDRPEARLVLEQLLGTEASAEASRSYAPVGLYPVSDLRPTDVEPGPARLAAERLVRGLALGTFHPDATDLMPTEVGSRAFPSGVVTYIEWSGEDPDALVRSVLAGIERAWPTGWP
jgi:DNA-binding SARP family transcriptional activator